MAKEATLQVRMDSELKEQAEIEAILAALSAKASEFINELSTNYNVVVKLDFIFAKAALSRHYKCSEPIFNQNGRVHIKDGRHPLLDVQKVVPVTVWLGDTFDLLIVTGIP